MKCFYLLLAIFTIQIEVCVPEYYLLVKHNISQLFKYKSYRQVQISHIQIPEWTLIAVILIQIQFPNSACRFQKISAYIKYGGFPLVNPDNAKLPKEFGNISRLGQYRIKVSNEDNITRFYIDAPRPGSYYLAMFLPFEDPRQKSIKPTEFKQTCKIGVEVSVFVSRIVNFLEIQDGFKYIHRDFFNSEPYYYRFFVPKFVRHAAISISLSPNVQEFVVSVSSQGIPSPDNYIASKTFGLLKDNFAVLSFATEEDKWHFLRVVPLGGIRYKKRSSLTFSLRYFSDFKGDERLPKVFQSNNVSEVAQYKEYSSVSHFSGIFNIHHLRRMGNLTVEHSHPHLDNKKFLVVSFKVDPNEIGGVLVFETKVEVASVDNFVLIVCVRPQVLELPTLPNFCTFNNKQVVAPAVLKSITEKKEFLIPYPESGDWYASLRLFCGNTSCPKFCKSEYKLCFQNCEARCFKKQSCSNCYSACSVHLSNIRKCRNCTYSNSCEVNATLAISSKACANNCNNHGKCAYIVAAGGLLTTCICSRNYRGWDCSDDTYVTPYHIIVLGLCLLVLSNLIFLLTVYVAFKRRHYVEAIVYFSVFFFSTFYHACDAGENVISYCMTRSEALQFADVYVALLSLWVTMVAVADLPSYWPNVCHMVGVIVLPFVVYIKKQAMWTYALPAGAGVVIVAVSWTFKWFKFRRVCMTRRYLFVFAPLGVILVTFGLLIFTFLQTASNYIYLHSLWHVVMATSIIMFLPTPTTFTKDNREIARVEDL